MQGAYQKNQQIRALVVLTGRVVAQGVGRERVGECPGEATGSGRVRGGSSSCCSDRGPRRSTSWPPWGSPTTRSHAPDGDGARRTGPGDRHPPRTSQTGSHLRPVGRGRATLPEGL